VFGEIQDGVQDGH